MKLASPCSIRPFLSSPPTYATDSAVVLCLEDRTCPTNTGWQQILSGLYNSVPSNVFLATRGSVMGGCTLHLTALILPSPLGSRFSPSPASSCCHDRSVRYRPNQPPAYRLCRTLRCERAIAVREGRSGRPTCGQVPCRKNPSASFNYGFSQA